MNYVDPKNPYVKKYLDSTRTKILAVFYLNLKPFEARDSLTIIRRFPLKYLEAVVAASGFSDCPHVCDFNVLWAYISLQSRPSSTFQSTFFHFGVLSMDQCRVCESRGQFCREHRRK